jgi:hypothetical protein
MLLELRKRGSHGAISTIVIDLILPTNRGTRALSLPVESS